MPSLAESRDGTLNGPNYLFVQVLLSLLSIYIRFIMQNVNVSTISLEFPTSGDSVHVTSLGKKLTSSQRKTFLFNTFVIYS